MERKQLERRTAYAYQRGVLAIPGGLLAIVFALGNWQVGPFANDLVVVGALAVLAGAWYAIDRAYRRRYGYVTPSQGTELRTLVAIVVVIGLVFGGSTLLHSLDAPVNPIAVAMPVAILAMYAIFGMLRAHHLVIWGTVLVVGALPIWDGPPDPGNVALVICGAASMLSGALDHLAFTRLLAAPALDA